MNCIRCKKKALPDNSEALWLDKDDRICHDCIDKLLVQKSRTRIDKYFNRQKK